MLFHKAAVIVVVLVTTIGISYHAYASLRNSNTIGPAVVTTTATCVAHCGANGMEGEKVLLIAVAVSVPLMELLNACDTLGIDAVFAFVVLAVGSSVELRSKAGVTVVSERERVPDSERDDDVDNDILVESDRVMFDRDALTSDFESDDIEPEVLMVALFELENAIE